MEITSEVFQVGGEGFTSAEDAGIYLIRKNETSALIDAGCGFDHERLINNIDATGTDITQVQLLLLTHCHFDHCGGAQKLREQLSCKILAHQLDAIYLEDGDDEVTAASWYNASMKSFKLDRKLSRDEETINLGGHMVAAIHIPGHSPGSVAYLIESDGKRILFGQDVHGPLHPSLKSNEMEYKASLKKLLTLKADILCEGHYGVIVGKKPVADFIASYL